MPDRVQENQHRMLRCLDDSRDPTCDDPTPIQSLRWYQQERQGRRDWRRCCASASQTFPSALCSWLELGSSSRAVDLWDRGRCMLVLIAATHCSSGALKASNRGVEDTVQNKYFDGSAQRDGSHLLLITRRPTIELQIKSRLWRRKRKKGSQTQSLKRKRSGCLFRWW